MSAMTSGIYFITCTANGSVYVGSSKHVEKRFWSHRSELKKNIHGNSRMQYTYNKYGKESFKYETVQVCDVYHLISVENSYLSYLRSRKGDLCLNMRVAGWSPIGAVFSGETKARMSKAKTGIKFTDEARANMSAAQKGKAVSAETRAKISANSKRIGVSPETRQKMASAMRGKRRPAEVMEKLRAANVGRTLSEDHKRKIRENVAKQDRRPHTEASKEKMRIAARRREAAKKETEQ